MHVWLALLISSLTYHCTAQDGELKLHLPVQKYMYMHIMSPGRKVTAPSRGELLRSQFTAAASVIQNSQNSM